MTITKFDRGAVARLQAEVTKTIALLAEQHGLKVQGAGGSYDHNKATLKFRFDVLNPEVPAVTFNATAMGLPEKFTSRGTEYRVVGYEFNRPKFPVTAERVSDGKKFKFPDHAVRRLPVEEVVR